MKIVYGTEPYRIDHEVRKLAENTTYYVQVFDAIDGVKEFLQSISFFGIPCAIYKVEDVKKERKELLHLMEECPESSCLIIRTEKLDNSKDWNAWKSKHGICCDKLNGKSYQCWIQKAFQSDELTKQQTKPESSTKQDPNEADKIVLPDFDDDDEIDKTQIIAYIKAIENVEKDIKNFFGDNLEK